MTARQFLIGLACLACLSYSLGNTAGYNQGKACGQGDHTLCR